MVNSLDLEDHTSIFCDSQSAIHLSENQVFHEMTEHIDVRFHFVRDCVSRGDVIIEKIAAADNPTDMLTKPVLVSKFKHCLDLVGVLSR